MLSTTRFQFFFFDRQQEYALKSAKKGKGGGAVCPMYTGYVHRKNQNTLHTKMVHTNK